MQAEPISDIALATARKNAAGGRVAMVTALQEVLGVTNEALALRLATTIGWPVLDMEALRGLSPAFDCMPYAECVRRRCIVARSGDALVGVTADPFDHACRSVVEARIGPLNWHVAGMEDLAACLAWHEDALKAMEGGDTAGAEPGIEASAEEISLSSIAMDDSPVVRLVNSTIYDAIKAGASDIHFEATAGGLTIRYRIDGVLTQLTTLPGVANAEQVVSRIKVMAELDIAERRIPQDGRFRASIRRHATDFRVSVMPSAHGEDVVIRVLDKRALTDQFASLRLDLLGFDAESLATLRVMIREPYGMLLVTGPTGSGKTTTLYAALSEINTGHDKIVTIEDPVEYAIPGILQIPVNEKKGLTFSRGLRSILRHDPDKILVGEIRDAETAQIAVQSALTGHLVFTSVHANNVFDVLGRFAHMGLDSYSFVSALNGIVAQRLIRLVCEHCAEEVSHSDEELHRSGIAYAGDQPKFMKGRGCGQCRGTGYRGRSAIAEILRMDDELRELIASKSSISGVKAMAVRKGTILLRQSAIALLGQGRTTLEEINRVTFAG